MKSGQAQEANASGELSFDAAAGIAAAAEVAVCCANWEGSGSLMEAWHDLLADPVDSQTAGEGRAPASGPDGGQLG